MRELMRVGGAVASAVAVLLLGASAVASDGSTQAYRVKGVKVVVGGLAAVQGLLVWEPSTYSQRDELDAVTIVTLAGKRPPVPTRVRAFPLGVSPDARLVAGVSTLARVRGAVVLGPVRGGLMKTVLRGDCTSPPCPYGADPSYAWSPDSRRLAVAAHPAHGPTLLKLADRKGRVTRSFTLPRSNPEQAGRAYHRLDSWSPDGSRLLVTRYGDFGPSAVVTLDVDTGRLRTWRPPHGWGAIHYMPDLAWSPNGRFVAVTNTGTQDAIDVFAVFDAATSRAVLLRLSGREDLPEASTAPVWASDGRSLFVRSLGGIDRLSLNGRRSNVIRSTAGSLTPRVALPYGLVYEAEHAGRPALYLYRFATRHRDLLFSSRNSIGAVLPLTRLP